jgi:hypothetical protein
MLLGPSFTFGWGVDYELSFAGVLERLLQERRFAGGKKIEIIDAGIPAIPVTSQLTWFERAGKGYTPDLLIQFISESMAIPDVAGPLAAVDDDGYLVPFYNNASTRWRARLKTLATVFYGWMLWTKLNSGSSEFPAPDFNPTRPAVREAVGVYNKLASIVHQTGARLLIVHVPRSYAIHEEDESRWRHLGVLNIPGEIAFDAAFVRYLNEHQIHSMDLTPQLKTSAQAGQRMYYWLDIHWTPSGNAVAAQAVADYLINRD